MEWRYCHSASHSLYTHTFVSMRLNASLLSLIGSLRFSTRLKPCVNASIGVTLFSPYPAQRARARMCQHTFTKYRTDGLCIMRIPTCLVPSVRVWIKVMLWSHLQPPASEQHCKKVGSAHSQRSLNFILVICVLMLCALIASKLMPLRLRRSVHAQTCKRALAQG